MVICLYVFRTHIQVNTWVSVCVWAEEEKEEELNTVKIWRDILTFFFFIFNRH